MFVLFSARAVPITARPNADKAGNRSVVSIPWRGKTIGSLRKQRIARGIRKNTKVDDYVVTLSALLPEEAPSLTWEAFEKLGRRDPLAAALMSVVTKLEYPSSA